MRTIDIEYRNRIHRSLQDEENCNALWPRGQSSDSTLYSFDSCHHCMGCSISALEVQYKSTSKKEINKPNCISGENAGCTSGQDYENGGYPVSSYNYRKYYILHQEREDQRLLFQDFNSWWLWEDRRGESCDIQNEQSSCESEKNRDEYSIFECQNRRKVARLQAFLGPLCRNGTMKGSSWKNDYPKTPCHFIHPNNKPNNGKNISSMSAVPRDNRFNSVCNNSSLVVEMIANKSDRNRVVTSLHMKIESDDLQINCISCVLMEIAQCGFNHVIIIGEIHCGLLFLDCYERVFKWNSLVGIFLFYGNFFEAIFEKNPSEALWSVSLDGTVRELYSDDLDPELPDELNERLVKDKKKDKKKVRKKARIRTKESIIDDTRF